MALSGLNFMGRRNNQPRVGVHDETMTTTTMATTTMMTMMTTTTTVAAAAAAAAEAMKAMAVTAMAGGTNHNQL